MTQTAHPRFRLMVVIGVLALLVAGTAGAQDKSITIMTWGVWWKEYLQDVAKKFEAQTGIKVQFVAQSNSGEGLVKLQAMKSRPTIDVWFTTLSVAQRAVKDTELFATLQAKDLSNWDDVMPEGRTPQYVPVWYFPFGIIYRPDLVPRPITRWEDLWDPAFGNKIAIPSMNMFQGRMLLVASLLNGGTQHNVDPGFEALKRLRPNIALIYGTDAQARQALAQGEVSVLAATSGHLGRMRAQGINVKMVSPRPAPSVIDVMVPVRTGREAWAVKFIDFMLSKEIQEGMTRVQTVGAVNRKAAPSPAFIEALPKAGDEVMFDEEHLNRSIPAWHERFNREIAK